MGDQVLRDEVRDPSLQQHKRILPSQESRSQLRQAGFTWVLSSNVSGVAQRDDGLYIRFHNGSVYRYPTQADKFENILNAESKGRWVWNNLRRTNVAYSKIGALPMEEDIDVDDEEVMKPLLSTQQIREVETLTATFADQLKDIATLGVFENPEIALLSTL